MTPDRQNTDRIDAPAEALLPRRRQRRQKTHLAVNLTSLIDVTFLLLIYFMVATDFRIREQIYRLDLPDRGELGRQRDPFALDEDPLRIKVMSSDADPKAVRLQIDGPYDELRTFADLSEFLTARQINDRTTGGLFEPDHPIIIVPTRTTHWEHVVEVFNCAAKARYTNVTFSEPAA